MNTNQDSCVPRLPAALRVLSRGGWSEIVQIRGIMCSDGVRRVTSWCGMADSYFTLPCHVKIRGKTVSGFAMAFRRADGGHDWQFCASRSGKNAFVLPDRSIYAITRNGCGTMRFSEPAGYLGAKVGDAVWNEETGEVHTIATIWPGAAFRDAWRMEFARDGWTQACDVE